MNSNAEIFVVEDSPDIRELMQLLFESEGYAVDFASDGKEALEKLRARSQPPAVILLDLMMPGMDGVQFRKAQESDAKLTGIPVLVMTADPNVEEKANTMGASGYLRKPISVDALLKVAAKYGVRNPI